MKIVITFITGAVLSAVLIDLSSLYGQSTSQESASQKPAAPVQWLAQDSAA